MKAGCRVKICGITNSDDAGMAAREGASYIGVLIEVSYSPRSQTVEGAVPIFFSLPIPVVALVHEMQPSRLAKMVKLLRPYAIQFLGQDGAEMAEELKKLAPELQIWQSLFLPAAGDAASDFAPEPMLRQIKRCREAGVDAVVLDTVAVINGMVQQGGTGTTGKWDLAAQLVAVSPLPVFLAGGLSPDNVRLAVETVRPYGIDLSSGVELYKGKKSLAKLQQLMKEVRKAKIADNY